MLLALIAGGTYWSLSQSDSQDPSGLDPSTRALTPEDADGAAAALVAEQNQLAQAELAGQAPTGTRQTAQAQGPTLAVRVILPDKTPMDPTLRVLAMPGKSVRSYGGRKHLDALARGEELDFPWCEAPIRPDGTASLALLADIEKPSLILDGEFLYVEKGVPIDGKDSVELRPRLGASLQLAMTTPDGLVPRGEVRLMGGNFSGQQMAFSSRVSPVSQSLFRGLTADLNWMVLPQLEEHFTHGKLGVKLAAGERREVKLDLDFGCLVEGTVVDDDGAPMPKITVNLVNKQPWARMAGSIETKTDEQGRFSLGRVGSGKQTIEAKREGRLDVQSPELDLIDGEVREGVQLVLSLGNTISGTVFGTDGAPVRRAAVSASHRTTVQRFGPPRRGQNQTVGKSITDKDGHFEITGLEAKKYTIQAKKAGRGSLGGQANLRASKAAVEAGTAGLRLDLQPPLILEGRVVDDSGQPITAFRLRGKSVESGGPDESETFEDTEGRFQFEKLAAGRWNISVKADGFHLDETHTVKLPRGEGPMTIVLQRESSIAGQVLSPTGSPISGATVRANNGAGTTGWGPRRGPQTEADDEGVFLLEGLAPGTYLITASGTDWADSEAATVELIPGATEEGLVLQLRVGG
ncbi:MAG: carboxypeptidase-like regulatory domain-containing protein, partial [Sulfitobacter sp.]|nr:carboxypeptidase-like regulatory domain-containing protein [Sulfitobacter sp.]